MGPERIVSVNGDRAVHPSLRVSRDPVVLLIGGAAATMDWWEDEFCERIAAGGRYVIRYDHRDTGRSTTSPAGQPNYTGMDLTADAIGLLDALDVGQAHLVGISMGGGIAQEIALDHPDRVASLIAAVHHPRRPGRAGPSRAAIDVTRSCGRASAIPAPTPTGVIARSPSTRWSRASGCSAGATGWTSPAYAPWPAGRSTAPSTSRPVRPTTGSWTAASRPAPRSARSRHRRWSCTAPTTRCSRSVTARPWPGRSRAPA